MKKYLFFVAFLVLFSGCSQKPAPVQPAPVESKGIPMETVAEHGLPGDCWVVINNNVYNVTDYLSSHPGGKSIEQGCGKDATQMFETRPMGSKTPHSDRARSMLEKYYIGDLKR